MNDEPKKNSIDYPSDLENQFILRLPQHHAASLRSALRSGATDIENRLSIKLEPDMRHATVQFDNYKLPAKLHDLPTIIESSKTLDGKIFYKTADICQILIAQEGEPPKSDEEVSPKKKDKDAKDKRFVLPHGITPPLKNVRRCRFRKTLKKKFVDLPNIEKEVKRLLKADYEATSVRYEVINAEDDKGDKKNSDGFEDLDQSFEEEKSNSHVADVAEYDLFGEVLSSSDESDDEGDVTVDEGAIKKLESIIEENDDESQNNSNLVDLTKGMKLSTVLDRYQEVVYGSESDSIAVSQLESATAGENLGQLLQEQQTEERIALVEKLDKLELEIASLQAKRRNQELEIMGIENMVLKQRFQSSIDRLKQEEYEKQLEYNDLVSLLRDN